jgi:hypothetical protein
MSPEQARGERGIQAAADVFSLGAILFECLAGQPPFSGEHFAAVLAKILFAEPPLLSRLRPDIPATLEALVLRMLHKSPAVRPRDADAVVAAMQELGPLPDAPPQRQPRSTRQRLTHDEQHFVCVLAAAEPHSGLDSEATIYPESLSAEAGIQRERLESSLSTLGAEGEWLPDGSLVCNLGRISHIADQARQAARAALHIARQWPTARVVVATGQGQTSHTSGHPMGAALERVISLLRRQTSDGIVLDELTARFLDARFRTEARPDGLLTLLAIEDGGLTPRLLGRPTPFVGREAELANLRTLYRTCKEDSVARAVLVSAPPGAGKSRLLQELRRGLAEEADYMFYLQAQADPMGISGSGGLLGQAIGRFCGLPDAEGAENRRAILKRLAAEQSSSAEAARVAVFLGELCGVPFPDGEHSLLAAARLSPQVCSEQMSQAVVQLFSTLCREKTTLFVIEDLHWGDEQTVRFLDAVLRELEAQPLLVLAFARPEVHEVFPRLWADRDMQELRLPPLGKRACEQLIKSALGDRLDSDVRARLIAQSSGNALFLEEPVRPFHKARRLREFSSVMIRFGEHERPCFEEHPHRARGARAVHAAYCMRLYVPQKVRY